MAKLKSDMVTAPTIEQYLAENDDFAFEIRCLQQLRKSPALNVAHGGTYSDPVTGKSRQFDFRIQFSPLPALRIAVALECKNLKPNFPLIISRLPRLKEEAFHQLLVQRAEDTPPSNGWVVSVVSRRLLTPSDTITIGAPRSPYVEREMVGKSTAQVGKSINDEFYSDDSEVYEKWAQAVSSAYGLISEAHHSFYGREDHDEAYFFVPVVVVPDNTLWVVDYLADGTVAGKPHTVDETAFFIDHSPSTKGQTFSYTISHIHFVTLTALDSFIGRHLVNSNFHRSLLPSE